MTRTSGELKQSQVWANRGECGHDGAAYDRAHEYVLWVANIKSCLRELIRQVAGGSGSCS